MNKYFNLVNYIKETLDDKKSNIIELMRYELYGHLYSFGKHFKYPKENSRECHYLLRDYTEYFSIKVIRNRGKQGGKKILSSAYSIWNNHLADLGYDVWRPAWNLRRDFKIDTSVELYLITKKITHSFNNCSFNYLISNDFFLIIEEYINLFRESCIKNSYAALIVPQDVGFFEKTAIKVFKDLNRPSFFWAHGGMPNIYDLKMDNRTDYSIQWGQKQVSAYINMGFDGSKFFISGHPVYNKKPESLRFDLDNILIITKCLNGASPLDELHFEDRGNAILYLNSIQRVLQGNGIKTVRLRPHPSENYEWYKKFIDNSFYVQDKELFSNALIRSTLVIGPISTSFIDSLYHQVNYIVYEPVHNNLTIMDWPIAPPLDGLDSRIPVARTESDLDSIIKSKLKIDVNIYEEFVRTPFDINFFNKLI
jgi:hypothetical protein